MANGSLQKHEDDLKKLIHEGQKLLVSFEVQHRGEKFLGELANTVKDEKERKKILKSLPVFGDDYQIWYSEALVLIKQLLPDRLEDFKRLYEKPKTARKQVSFENYVIQDALEGLGIVHSVSREKLVTPADAIPKFDQQINIVRSIERRLSSSLFEIRQLTQADFFDSELDSAQELVKNGYFRAAGVIAGVVLEGHLSQVCINHNIRIKKKKPTINDYAQLLKDNNVSDVAEWRKIQGLADNRNQCGHKRQAEPKQDDVADLIRGVGKAIKSLS